MFQNTEAFLLTILQTPTKGEKLQDVSPFLWFHSLLGIIKCYSQIVLLKPAF